MRKCQKKEKENLSIGLYTITNLCHVDYLFVYVLLDYEHCGILKF